ncbi:MAG: hypothetical protein DMD43_03310 [Gemmatimonadetes bacterium]|nr:MAG: hypothetical protein DMD43_03310 [Gemmatimonadota bacterium]
MRNHTKTQILAALALAFYLIPGSDLMAQRRRGLVDVSPRSDRHGAWINFGLGAGSENYRFDSPDTYQPSDIVKPSFWIAVGGTVNPHLRLGGEINAWVNEYTDTLTFDHVTESLVGGLLTAQVFPATNLGLFFKGGVGISRSGTDISGGYGTGETGFATLLGAGYEVRLARNFFLTPVVNVLYHRSNGQRGDPNGALHERVATIGVGLTFQPGR